MNNSFGGGFGGQSGMRKRPVITDIVVSAITDKGFTVTALINPKGATLTPRLKFGETTSYGTMINASGGAISSISTVTFIVTGLQSFTEYYFILIAGVSNLAHPTAIETLSPSELQDPLNFSHYVYNDASNIKDGSNFVSQLRDISKGNVLSADVIGNGNFDSSTGFALGSGWGIAGGVASGVSGATSYLTKAVYGVRRVCQIDHVINSISGSYINLRGIVNSALRLSPGAYSNQNLICNGVDVGFAKNSTTNCEIDNFTLKFIEGNHAVTYTAGAYPTYTADGIRFNGTTNRLLSAALVPSIGTVYAVVKRVGVDLDFVVLNSLTGIGSYATSVLFLGSDSETNYYNFDLLELYIRPGGVTDSPGTIERVNNYLKKIHGLDGVVIAPVVADGVTDNYALLQGMINISAGYKIVIGSNLSDVVIISQPLEMISNSSLQINGTLKLIEGSVRPLSADAATGATVLNVANASGYFKVGQIVSISSDAMNVAGGGINPRHRMGQCTKVTDVSSTQVTLRDALKSEYLLGQTIASFLVAQNAAIGHTQTCIIIDNKTNVTLEGTGIIDGSIASQYDVEPIVIQSGIIYLEDQRGGNGIFVYQSSNVNISVDVKNTDLHGICLDQVTTFSIKNCNVSGCMDKGIIMLQCSIGVLENVNSSNQLNEDGITLYSGNTNISLAGIVCEGNPRSGLGVATQNTNITISNVQLTNNYLQLYMNTGSTRIANSNIVFTDVTIVGGAAPLYLHNQHDIVFNNLDISAQTSANAMINILAMCYNIQFNGGGVHDSIGRSGQGIGLYFSDSGSLAAAYGLQFNSFDLKRLKSAMRVFDSGLSDVVLTDCEIGENTTNGDIANTAFTYVGCTIT